MKTSVFSGLLILGAALFSAVPKATTRATESPALATRKPGVLQVCLYAGFAPVAYKQDGRWTGSDVDYLAAFAQANGLELEVIEQPQFTDIWLRPGQGQCDIAAGGITDTADRRAAVGSQGEWSSPYYEVVRAFLVRKSDAAGLTEVGDLRGRTVIVTRDSTAHQDLCYRMQSSVMRACRRPDGERACPNLAAVDKKDAPDCVAIDWPRGNDEANAAADLLAAKGPHPPHALGAGHVSVQYLAGRFPGLVLAWPHCNMTSYDGQIAPYSEPFSFVVSSDRPGVLRALNAFIERGDVPYAGAPIPKLGCKAPPEHGFQPPAHQ